MHKHPRKTSRPIIAKGTKSAHQKIVAAAAAIADANTQINIRLDRVKRFGKLLQRQEGAKAAETRAQIDEIRREIGEFQEEMRSLYESADTATGGAAAEEDKQHLSM